MVAAGSDFIDGYRHPTAEAGWIVGDVDGAGLRHLSHPGGE
ncbi:Uncharacterised protein [Mycobacterium tuberculosis]|nr:Uncharacterised protein [Mycobacterium tuberculosis]